jgi:hypothetical protein
VFTYAFNGFLVGSMVGLSGGYLAARVDGFEDGDWRPLAYGTGVGALAGGALGLTLGIVDVARDTPGFGAYILRDTIYGAGFGAAAGAIAGGLAALSTKEGEHVLLGASIGVLAGSAVGIGLGIVEGNRASSPRRSAAPAVSLALGAAAGADGSAVWMPAVAGRF